MRVRFFTQPEGEKYAGSVMVEKTIEDHTSAGVKPTVFVGKATEQDKAEFQAAFLEFSRADAPAPEATVEAVTTAAPEAKAAKGGKAVKAKAAK